MPLSGIVDSEQLKLLTTALDEYCRDNDIGPNSPERTDAGQIIIALFSNGAQNAEDLKTALQVTLQVKRMRRSGYPRRLACQPFENP